MNFENISGFGHHENKFEVTLIRGSDEIGYCEAAHAQYL